MLKIERSNILAGNERHFFFLFSIFTDENKRLCFLIQKGKSALNVQYVSTANFQQTLVPMAVTVIPVEHVFVLPVGVSLLCYFRGFLDCVKLNGINLQANWIAPNRCVDHYIAMIDLWEKKERIVLVRPGK